MQMSQGILFAWELEITTAKVDACPVYSQSQHCFCSMSLDWSSPQSPSGGGPPLRLICNLQNTLSYILEKYVATLCMGPVP